MYSMTIYVGPWAYGIVDSYADSLCFCSLFGSSIFLPYPHMNSHLFTQIPVTSKAKSATIYLGDEIFSKINLGPVKLPCKYYNLVFLAIETWINQEWDPGEKLMLWALNEEFSTIVTLMDSQLEPDVVTKLINESPLLTPFKVKLEYDFVI